MSCDLGMSLMGVSQKYRGPNTQSVDMLKFELLDFRRKPTSNSEVSFLGHIPIPSHPDVPTIIPWEGRTPKGVLGAAVQRSENATEDPKDCLSWCPKESCQKRRPQRRSLNTQNPLVAAKNAQGRLNSFQKEAKLQIRILRGYHHELAECRVYMLSVSVTT